MNMFLNHNQAITFLLILIHRLGLFICFEVDFQYLNYSIFFSKPSPAYQLSFKIVLVLIRRGDSNLLDSLACMQCKKSILLLFEISYCHKYVLYKFTPLVFSFPWETIFSQLLSPQPFFPCFPKSDHKSVTQECNLYFSVQRELSAIAMYSFTQTAWYMPLLDRLFIEVHGKRVRDMGIN